jgi:hypothetical protein
MRMFAWTNFAAHKYVFGERIGFVLTNGMIYVLD